MRVTHIHTHTLVHQFGTISYVQGMVASVDVSYEYKLYKQLTERIPASNAICIHFKLNPAGAIKHNYSTSHQNSIYN
jgi:hypothetical protein